MDARIGIMITFSFVMLYYFRQYCEKRWYQYSCEYSFLDINISIQIRSVGNCGITYISIVDLDINMFLLY